MSKIRHVQFRPDEYIVGVSPLTAEQQGVFWMVCALIMSHGGPIPADHKRIAHLTNIRPSKAKRICDALIACGKLSESGGKLSQKRAETEVKSAQKRSENGSKSGQISGVVRRENKDLEEKSFNDPDELTNNHKPITNNQNKDLNPRARGDSPRQKALSDADRERDAQFERWYARYPRRCGKGQARRAFLSAVSKIEFDALFSAVQSFAERCAETDPKFIPHPATWLNGERWLDDETVVAFEPQRSRVVF